MGAAGWVMINCVFIILLLGAGFFEHGKHYAVSRDINFKHGNFNFLLNLDYIGGSFNKTIG